MGDGLPAKKATTAESVVLGLVRNNVVRRSAVRLADRAIREFLRRTNNPPGVARDEWLTLRGLMYSLDRALDKGLISEHTLRGLISFARRRLKPHPAREAFREKYGDYPPGFLTISPTRACNLHCKGCYAGTEEAPKTLEFNTFDRILREMKELWGAAFAVISGGEPFMYRSGGHDLLDMAERHPDMYFLVYTNGTLIDREVARRLEELGNVTPAISVEGRVATTEERRGKGVFGKVMEAFANLREAGVPFGISMTATRGNCDELLSDEVVEFYFEEQGAMYGWIFQYMPIGRDYDLSLMITPEQRLRLQRRIWQVIREKRVFLIDFWNSGTAVHGCLAAGRQAGYFYVNWNGDITPCVFVPYAAANIYEIYERGGTIMDLMEIDFFKEIRSWQKMYGYKTRPHETKNLILPCPHRDHFEFMQGLIERYKPKPINIEAAQAIRDPSYCQGLKEYNRACAALLDPVWKSEYLQGLASGDEHPKLEPVAQGQRSGAGAQ
ncbi:MAG: Radical SAM domain protein [Acetothermia bacterium 64_32]|nr:MAG: Radical SAM domain protein [Acetothermia bacterium 64_32]HAF71028.1 radical SAM protein [Candidatus Acetothermia bacterium]